MIDAVVADVVIVHAVILDVLPGADLYTPSHYTFGVPISNFVYRGDATICSLVIYDVGRQCIMFNIKNYCDVT